MAKKTYQRNSGIPSQENVPAMMRYKQDFTNQDVYTTARPVEMRSQYDFGKAEFNIPQRTRRYGEFMFFPQTVSAERKED
jgi:hypothetical protein